MWADERSREVWLHFIYRYLSDRKLVETMTLENGAHFVHILQPFGEGRFRRRIFEQVFNKMQEQLLYDFGSIGFLAHQNGPEEHLLCHTAHAAVKCILDNLFRNPSPPHLSLASWSAMGKLKPFEIAENEEPLAGRLQWPGSTPEHIY